MRILLVRPPRIKKAITIGEFMFCEPIGLEAVYAVLKNNYTLKIFDMMIEKSGITEECISWRPDVVGFTSLCIDVENVLQLAKEVKQHNPKIITVVGGTQAYLLPEAFFDKSVDHVMKFSTSANLLELFNSISGSDFSHKIDGVLSKVNSYESNEAQGRNEYIVPDIESTKRYRKHYSYFGYKPAAIIQTSQGCSKHCRFCLRWRIEGGEEIDQDINIISDQILRIEEPSIMIFDNDFLYSADRINELCEYLEQHNIKKNFMCYGSVASVLRNKDAIMRFKQSGLAAVLIGYESFNEEELESYNKNSTASEGLEAAQFLRENNIDAWASFIMHPDWDKKDFKNFRKHIRQLNPQVSSLTPLTPFPGTPLYKEYKDRLIYNKPDYNKWSFATVSILPSKLHLKIYYLEILKTNIYINIFMNNTWYLIEKFGLASLSRILFGSLKLSLRYLWLLVKA